MDDLQRRVLYSALPHVPFDGWTMEALERGAKDAGLVAEEAHRAFPGGVLDALDAFNADADARMEDVLARDYTLATMRMRERIATCVMVRLRGNLPYREAIRRGLPHYTMPWNAARGMKRLYATVDAMWKAAGDSSTDFNFYTKRMTLAKVYMATLYVWLDDTSPELQDTEAFLHRRIENVMQIEKAKAKLREGWSQASAFFDGRPRKRA